MLILLGQVLRDLQVKCSPQQQKNMGDGEVGCIVVLTKTELFHYELSRTLVLFSRV